MRSTITDRRPHRSFEMIGHRAAAGNRVDLQRLVDQKRPVLVGVGRRVDSKRLLRGAAVAIVNGDGDCAAAGVTIRRFDCQDVVRCQRLNRRAGDCDIAQRFICSSDRDVADLIAQRLAETSIPKIE